MRSDMFPSNCSVEIFHSLWGMDRSELVEEIDNAKHIKRSLILAVTSPGQASEKRLLINAGFKPCPFLTFRNPRSGHALEGWMLDLKKKPPKPKKKKEEDAVEAPRTRRRRPHGDNIGRG